MYSAVSYHEYIQRSFSFDDILENCQSNFAASTVLSSAVQLNWTGKVTVQLSAGKTRRFLGNMANVKPEQYLNCYPYLWHSLSIFTLLQGIVYNPSNAQRISIGEIQNSHPSSVTWCQSIYNLSLQTIPRWRQMS